MVQNKRNSRFEILRLISIFIIILHHLTLHSAIDDYVGISFNRVISQLYLIGGKVGVNCFLLITGYYGMKSQFKLSKAIRIELQVLFYTIFFFGISFFVYPDFINIKSFLQAVMPVTFGTYWYITAYMALLLISPFANIVIKNINQKQYRYLLFIILFMESLAPTFLRQRNWASDFVWFVLVYFVGAYIKKYDLFLKLNKNQWLQLAVISYIITWGVSIVLLFLSVHINRLQAYVNVFSLSNYSTFLLCISVSLFMYFCSCKPIYNDTINSLSKATLGIYLIQSNPFVSTILWNSIKKFGFHFSKLWPLLAIIISFLVFSVCGCIEHIRIKLFDILQKKFPIVEMGYRKINMMWMEDL